MTLKKRATAAIAIILIGGAVVVGTLHYFSKAGQFAPAGLTGDATKSDQRDPKIDGASGQPRTAGQPVTRP